MNPTEQAVLSRLIEVTMEHSKERQRIRCPRCITLVYSPFGEVVYEDPPASVWGDDGSGHSMWCEKCGLDFTVHETVTRTFEIGDYDPDQRDEREDDTDDSS